MVAESRTDCELSDSPDPLPTSSCLWFLSLLPSSNSRPSLAPSNESSFLFALYPEFSISVLQQVAPWEPLQRGKIARAEELRGKVWWMCGQGGWSRTQRRNGAGKKRKRPSILLTLGVVQCLGDSPLGHPEAWVGHWKQSWGNSWIVSKGTLSFLDECAKKTN